MKAALFCCNVDHVQPYNHLLVALPRHERARAQEFSRPADRLRFAAARVLLRRILAAQSGIAPERIAIEIGHNGKPFADGHRPFNIAHSGSIVLIGIADQGLIGVDVEVYRPLDDLEALATSCFAPGELHAFRGLGEHERKPAFFRAWTRKEALLKALGLGLGTSLRDVCVALHKDDGRKLLLESAAVSPTENWLLRDAALHSSLPCESYEAAVAVNDPECQIEVFASSADLQVDKSLCL